MRMHLSDLCLRDGKMSSSVLSNPEPSWPQSFHTSFLHHISVEPGLHYVPKQFQKRRDAFSLTRVWFERADGVAPILIIIIWMCFSLRQVLHGILRQCTKSWHGIWLWWALWWGVLCKCCKNKHNIESYGLTGNFWNTRSSSEKKLSCHYYS